MFDKCDEGGPMKTKIAIYTRVSTQDQSVDMQITDLRRYCEQRGFEIYKDYSDLGISGVKDKRPALDELMSDAKKRKFDAVLCWRFDRFARSTKHLITALEEFRHLGIDFVSYQENIDTSSPLGKALFVIVSAIAELERNILLERVRAGLKRAKENGRILGRPRRLDLDVKELQQMRDKEKLSFRQIAKRVKACPATVYKSLKNPVRKNP
jgi:DNA invertase Pin-like site-specific DNA recombinase